MNRYACVPLLNTLRAMTALTALTAGLAGLTGCATSPKSAGTAAAEIARFEGHSDTTSDGTSTARSLGAYKVDLAQRISETDSTHVYVGQPQALLRAVVVVKFTVDASGKLLRSEIVRGNRDSATENTALASLRRSAPFPKPAAALLRNGRVEITETYLFNNDGRYQIRSIAKAQMAE